MANHGSQLRCWKPSPASRTHVYAISVPRNLPQATRLAVLVTSEGPLTSIPAEHFSVDGTLMTVTRVARLVFPLFYLTFSMYVGFRSTKLISIGAALKIN